MTNFLKRLAATAAIVPLFVLLPLSMLLFPVAWVLTGESWTLWELIEDKIDAVLEWAERETRN